MRAHRTPWMAFVTITVVVAWLGCVDRAVAQGGPGGPPPGSQRNFGRGLPGGSYSPPGLTFPGTYWVKTTYDARGNPLVQDHVYDADSDGQVDGHYVWSHVWDDAGHDVEERYDQDWDADGVIDAAWIATRTYSASGLELTRTEVDDAGADGVPDSLRLFVYTYDGRGLLLAQDFTFDRDMDGVPDFTAWLRQTWDRSGRLLTKDGGDDQGVSATSVFGYDRRGRLATVDSDMSSYWGTQESHSEYDYDAQGRLAMETTWTQGTGLFQIPTTIWYTPTWSRRGQLLEEVWTTDQSNDGTIDQVMTNTWTFDRKGNLQQLYSEMRRGWRLQYDTTVYFSY